MAYGKSNGHVLEDVTRPVAGGWRCMRLTPVVGYMDYIPPTVHFSLQGKAAQLHKGPSPTVDDSVWLTVQVLCVLCSDTVALHIVPLFHHSVSISSYSCVLP